MNDGFWNEPCWICTTVADALQLAAREAMEECAKIVEYGTIGLGLRKVIAADIRAAMEKEK
jgi:hypothetical protein